MELIFLANLNTPNHTYSLSKPWLIGGKTLVYRCPVCVLPMSSLTPQQLQAVSMLANGKNHVEIALELGITTKTVQRWIKKPEFAQAVADVQLKAIEKTVERTSEEIARHSQEIIQRLVPKALKVINDYLSDSSAKGSDRLRAVHIVGSWAGLNQQTQVKPEQSAEQNLKDYLSYLEANKNGANSNASN